MFTYSEKAVAQAYLVTLLEFNDWLQEKADTHDRMKAVKFKTKTDEPPVVNKTKTTSKASRQTQKLPTQNRRTRQQETGTILVARTARQITQFGNARNSKVKTQLRERKL